MRCRRALGIAMTIILPTPHKPAEALLLFGHTLRPGEHLVLIYKDTDTLLNKALESFVSEGLLAGSGVIVVADSALRYALQERLLHRGFDLESARARHQYVVLDAQEVLAQCGGLQTWVNERRFEQFFTPLIEQASTPERPVRIFGAMVNVLWGRGKCDATFHLEGLWHNFCRKKGVVRLCAYWEHYFIPNLDAPARQIIYGLHSRSIFL